MIDVDWRGILNVKPEGASSFIRTYGYFDPQYGYDNDNANTKYITVEQFVNDVMAAKQKIQEDAF